MINNVTKFINEDGKVIVCETCLEIAGFEKDDLLDGAILDTSELTSKILTNATVVDYIGGRKLLFQQYLCLNLVF